MLRSAVGQTSDEFNEVSVSSQRAEHLQASDSSHSAGIALSRAIPAVRLKR